MFEFGEPSRTKNFEHETSKEEEEEEEEEVFDYEMYSKESDEESSEPVLIAIDCKDDYLDLDLQELGPDELRYSHYANVQLAFDFYSWYSRIRGFSARRGTIKRNTKGEHVQQTFMCHRQGFRQENGTGHGDDVRKRKRRPDYRCGCEAKFRVRIDQFSQRWYVTRFDDKHNHELFPTNQAGMLPGHRTMNEADIVMVNTFLKAGNRAPAIYDTVATEAGGYENVGFIKKDMYNELAKQRKANSSDGKRALEYLHWLGLNDKLMFVRSTPDGADGVEHLFWADGISQLNYKLFGDVVAFDATYKKNKYARPVVVFSGVDHHNRTTVFATAIVSNETEETYVWLLEQFQEVMKGKLPGAVITDGCLAMRNAIRRVFPKAHHRLCAWHLLKGAAKRVAIPGFVHGFKKCMLGDYGIGEFKRRWATLVAELGLEDHAWVKDTYEKRELWATAYFRGKYFAGFRTTSRCEGFHSQLAKFVCARYNLTQFLQHYQRCLCYIRFKELEADFKTGFGEVEMITNYKGIERSVAQVLTKEIFNLFQPIITLAADMIVTEIPRAAGSGRYKVVRYTKSSKAWFVYADRMKDEFSCSCEKMETYGLPCEHILGVLVFLHITKVPKSLISTRWTKGAKDELRGQLSESSVYWDSEVVARYVCLLESCRELCGLACQSLDDFYDLRDKIASEKVALKGKNIRQHVGDVPSSGIPTAPAARRPRGRPRASKAGLQTKRINKCGACNVRGHNRQTCPLVMGISNGYATDYMEDDDNLDNGSDHDQE